MPTYFKWSNTLQGFSFPKQLFANLSTDLTDTKVNESKTFNNAKFKDVFVGNWEYPDRTNMACIFCISILFDDKFYIQ
jgi:hypothetical protein